MNYISVENLTKSYGIKTLFKDITFHINEGDKIAIVAKNGSGKSTLLKILMGKEVPDSGRNYHRAVYDEPRYSSYHSSEKLPSSYHFAKSYRDGKGYH